MAFGAKRRPMAQLYSDPDSPHEYGKRKYSIGPVKVFPPRNPINSMAFPAAVICSPSSPLVSLSSITILNSLPPSQTNPTTTFFSSEYYSKPFSSRRSCRHLYSSFRNSYRFSGAEEEGDDDCSFEEAVVLFNTREYYKCHDFLESLWNKAEEPSRTLIHGILQCAVGFHHLFNQVQTYLD